jgi:hypothetical protein
MAKHENLSIDQGSDVSIELTLTNMDKTPKDLTDYTITGKLAENYEADSADKLSFIAVVTNQLGGLVTLSLTNVQTDSLKAKRRYVYDVEASFLDSDTTIVERILEGNIYINPSVTR